MNTPTRAVAVLTAALIWLAPAVTAYATKVYRCGPDGRIYSQTPCKDGYEVNAADKRSNDQRKAAEDSVRREEQMTEKMARERQANEAAAARQGAITIANPAAAKSTATGPAAAASASATKQAGAKKDAGTKKDSGAKADKKP